MSALGFVKTAGPPNSLPEKRFLGKERTIQSIQYGTGTLPERPPTFYFVEFDSQEVMAISVDWLEPR